MSEMTRKQAIKELNRCLEVNEFPAWEAIAIAHKNLKLVEDVGIWLKARSKALAKCLCIPCQTTAKNLEQVLKMLTKANP